MDQNKNYWRKCGACKSEIYFNSVYQGCSVSSCRKYAYCSVDCWSRHDSIMGHRSAWAEERFSPKCEGNIAAENANPRRKIVVSKNASRTIHANKNKVPRDILIVASKLKLYVKEAHDLNTSGNVMDKLSDLVRSICDEAIINARNEGRKTLMDRDFK